MIIIDSITTLISPVLTNSMMGKDSLISSATWLSGYRLMAQVGQLLKLLAVKFDIAVVLTNNTVSDFSYSSSSVTGTTGGTGIGATKAALGEYWSQIPNTQMTFEQLAPEISITEGKQNPEQNRRATLTKSVFMEEQTCKFKIKPCGMSS